MNLYSQLARLRTALLAVFDPHYRSGRGWWRSMVRLNRPEFEQHQMTKLRALLEEFVANGTLAAADYGDIDSLRQHKDLARLPIHQRQEMIDFLPRLQEIYSGRSDLIVKQSTGSTAAPVRYLREKSLDRVAEGFYNEMYALTGWRPGVYRVGLWGNYREFGGNAQAASKSKLMHKWSISTFAPTREDFLRWHSEVLANPGCAVFGYASVIAEACRLLRREGLSVPAGHVQTCFTGAETLLPAMRREIEETLHCRVHDGYSSRESEHMAIECVHGTRHVSPRYIMETVRLDSDSPCSEGELGRLLVTDLFNRITPHVRYQIGDAASLAWSDCACGLKGQTLPQLQGRLSDYIRLPAGQAVSTLFFNGLFYMYEAADEMQLARTGDESFELRYVGSPLTAEEEESAIRYSQGLLGAVEIKVRQVDELPRSGGGKWKLYIDERPDGDTEPGVSG